MSAYLTLAIILWAYMTLWFVVSLLKKRNDVADVAWGLGFPLLAWISYSLTPHGLVDVEKTALVVNMLVTIWGVRLALHIYARNRGKPEDYRYAEWRAQWGRWFLIRSYAQVYLLQGVFLFLIALPVFAINLHNAYVLGPLELVGIAVWIFGFAFEARADAELARFVRNPANKGQIIQTGLWQYSRHPNYFGEVTEWWGIWIVAVAATGAWWSIVGPLTITFLILKVSGVPLLEKKMAQKPGFEEYRRKTSVFIPWFPRK